MKKVSLGLIGLGYIGKIHLRNCLNLELAKLAAVCDVSKKALRYAKKMGVRNTFTDYEQLLKDQKIDAVIIALPTHLHEKCALKAAESKKDIFLEKPLARNVKEGKEILAIAKRNGVKIMVGYPLRFTSSFLSLKEKIQSGVLGEVQGSYATFVASGPFFHRAERGIPHPVPEWWFNKEMTGGGVLIDLGCHLINLLRWYFGEITDIKSYLGYRFNMDIEDHATCIAKFESGSISIINVGWFSLEYQLKVELLGTVKHASAHRKPPNRIVAATQQLLFNSSEFWKPHLRELEYFTQCVKHDQPPSPSGNDALKDLEAISLAYKNEILLGGERRL